MKLFSISPSLHLSLSLYPLYWYTCKLRWCRQRKQQARLKWIVSIEHVNGLIADGIWRFLHTNLLVTVYTIHLQAVAIEDDKGKTISAQCRMQRRGTLKQRRNPHKRNNNNDAFNERQKWREQQKRATSCMNITCIQISTTKNIFFCKVFVSDCYYHNVL